MNFQFPISNFQLIAFLIICCLLWPFFIFAEEGMISSPPGDPGEGKEMGERVLEITKEKGPGIIEKIWKEEILPFWQGMINELRSFLALCFTRAWDWTKDCWEDTLWPRIKGLWEKRVKSPVKEEAEKRKEIIEEKVEKEKKEIEEKLIPEATKPFWEKLKDFWE